MFIAALPWGVSAGPIDELTMGEAFYMSGNLDEAAQRLSMAAASVVPSHAQRALYLLGRVSLLKGDFRQSKEYFERSVEVDEGKPSVKWMALAGIGDSLYASGQYEEAIRRYRIALGEGVAGQEGATIGLKIALCEHSLGREDEALVHLREALSQIPVLSGWVGREEEFYYSMAMVGMELPEPRALRFYVLAGPLSGDNRVDGVIGPDVRVTEVRKGGLSYLEIGPLADSVEAMILAEKIKSGVSIPAEIVSR